MKWISVEDKLPDNDQHVLCVYREWICTGIYHNSQFFLDDDREADAIVTHWMPLPEMP